MNGNHSDVIDDIIQSSLINSFIFLKEKFHFQLRIFFMKILYASVETGLYRIHYIIALSLYLFNLSNLTSYFKRVLMCSSALAVR